MGRKPKDAKRLYVKMDRLAYEALAAYCKRNGMTITDGLERGSRLLVNRRHPPKRKPAQW